VNGNLSLLQPRHRHENIFQLQLIREDRKYLGTKDSSTFYSVGDLNLLTSLNTVCDDTANLLKSIKQYASIYPLSNDS